MLRAIFNRPAVGDRLTAFYLIKHALNALKYRDLALADISPLPLVIVPDPSDLLGPEGVHDPRLDRDPESIRHLSTVFGRPFHDLEEARDWLAPLSEQEIVDKVAEPSRFIFNTEIAPDPASQLRQQLEHTTRWVVNAAPLSAGEKTFIGLVGRFVQSGHTLAKAATTVGTPLIDAPTSWQYLLWTYEYAAEAANPGVNRDLVIARALQAGAGDERLPLLSRVPHTALIELRREGALGGRREVIRKGIEDLSEAGPDDLTEASERVVANLEAALSNHKRELGALSGEKRKFFGFDIGAWVATTGVGIAAAANGNVPLAVVSTLLGTAGAPSVRDLYAKGKDLHRRSTELRRSATGILFQHMPSE